MRLRKIVIVFIFLFCFCDGSIAGNKSDSLLKLLPTKHGADRAKLLNSLSKSFWNSDPTRANEFAEQEIKIADSLNVSGLQYDGYYNSGVSKFYLADFPNALAAFLHSQQIAEQEKDKKHISASLNSIGSVYQSLEDYPKTLDYFERALKIREELKDTFAVASTLANLGGVLNYMERTKEGLADFQKALVIWRKMDYTEGVSNCYMGIGTIYSTLKNFDSSVVYFKRAAEIKEKSGDLVNYAGALHNIGDSYLFNNDNKTAEDYLWRSMKICDSLGIGELQLENYNSLAIAYKQAGDLKQSLECSRKGSVIKDTLFNEENSQRMGDMATKFEMQKKQNEITIATKNNELQEIKLKRGNTWLLVLVPGLFLFLLVMGVLSGRNKSKKKANELLRHQNELLSQQEIEITQSIQYSLSIQQSMLPDHDYISSSLKDYFVLNEPKDIVSGDFYFFERLGDHLVFSAVDCTGHGVPGALLSFLGMDILREAVRKRGLTKPSDILSFLDQEVHQRLQQSADGKSVRDGMDLALCSLNLKTNELQYAGSFNPVYIISENKLTEIKSDKHAIGSNDERKGDVFTNHTMQLKKDDRVYIFSDGYADQFGGPGGKKFKYKPMQNLLLQNHLKPMSEQRKILEETIHVWKGDLFQVDDILMIGIRIA